MWELTNSVSLILARGSSSSHFSKLDPQEISKLKPNLNLAITELVVEISSQ